MHLTLIQETGILGWLCMLWIFIAAIFTLYRSSRRATDPYLRSLLWAIVASVFGMLIPMIGLNVFLHLPLQVFFWGLMGLALGTVTHRVNGSASFRVLWRLSNDRATQCAAAPGARAHGSEGRLTDQTRAALFGVSR